MKIIRLYHGSPEENFVPKFGLGNDKHDYGRGFYLTEFPELAKEWSVALAYDEKRNPLRRTFDNLLEEDA